MKELVYLCEQNEVSEIKVFFGKVSFFIYKSMKLFGK